MENNIELMQNVVGSLFTITSTIQCVGSSSHKMANPLPRHKVLYLAIPLICVTRSQHGQSCSLAFNFSLKLANFHFSNTQISYIIYCKLGDITHIGFIFACQYIFFS